MNDIANNIKNLRKAKGLSQEQFAQMLHVTRQTVSAWERGVAQPSLDTLEEISKALEVEPEQLLYGTKQKQRPNYRYVSFWPVLGIIPLYLLMTLWILPIPMVAWLGGGHDVTFALCGQIFLAMEIVACYCGLKDTIQNREYYDQLEQEKGEQEE